MITDASPIKGKRDSEGDMLYGKPAKYHQLYLPGAPMTRTATPAGQETGALNSNITTTVNRMRQYTWRYAIPILLPVATVITTAVASINHGPVRVYWTLGTIGLATTTAFLAVVKDHNAAASREEAVNAKAALGLALTSAGQPLVAALGNVTVSREPEEAKSAIAVLTDRTVGLAQTEVASQSRIICNTRAAFYCFEGKDTLRRVTYQGRLGGNAPRLEFKSGRTAHDDEVIKFAHGENALLISDLENAPPQHFEDYKGRNYKCFISVPVRTARKSYGLLTADSDRAWTLSEIDKRFLILLAGTLASGLAHLEIIESTQKQP